MLTKADMMMMENNNEKYITKNYWDPTNQHLIEVGLDPFNLASILIITIAITDYIRTIQSTCLEIGSVMLKSFLSTFMTIPYY